ncbi:MAG: hypothetical protein HRT72_09685 [Flavobacteriales bacterium]|nr:hypothetical protein [Flavobacteriales bacterium]
MLSKISIILISLTLLLTVNSFAQEAPLNLLKNTTLTRSDVIHIIDSIDTRNRSVISNQSLEVRAAGQELKLYTRNHYIGIGLFSVGMLLANFAALQISSNTYGPNTLTIGFAGLIMWGGGALVKAESHIHVQRAGKFLTKAK